MDRETMICPVCGGTIEVEHGTDGTCDTCDTRLVDGKIVEESEVYSIRHIGKPLVAPRGQSRSLLRDKVAVSILRWISSPTEPFSSCPECGATIDKYLSYQYHFCPLCGIRLQKPEG